MSPLEDNWAKGVNSPSLRLLFYSGLHGLDEANHMSGRTICFTLLIWMLVSPRYTLAGAHPEWRLTKYLGSPWPSQLDRFTWTVFFLCSVGMQIYFFFKGDAQHHVLNYSDVLVTNKLTLYLRGQFLRYWFCSTELFCLFNITLFGLSVL